MCIRGSFCVTEKKCHFDEDCSPDYSCQPRNAKNGMDDVAKMGMLKLLKIARDHALKKKRHGNASV